MERNEKLINLLDKPVNLLGDTYLTIPPSKRVFVYSKKEERYKILGISVVRVKYDRPKLPDYEEGVYYIASRVLVDAAKENGRTIEDLLIPSDAIKDNRGNIIAYKQLISAT